MDHVQFAQSGGVDLDTVPAMDRKGMKFIERKVIPFDEIHVPTGGKDQKENTARQNNNNPLHQSMLRDSFLGGVRLDLPVPAVVKVPLYEENGSIVNYELAWGNNRMAVLPRMDGVESWEFDVYENVGEASGYDVSRGSMKENTDHAPQLPATHGDLVAWHVMWMDAPHYKFTDEVDGEYFVNEDKLHDSLLDYGVMDGRMRNGLVTKITKRSETHTTIKNYVGKEHINWIEKNMRGMNVVLDGPDRNTFIVKTGTDHRTLMELMKHSKANSDKVYDIILNPVVGGSKTALQAREDLVKSLDAWWDTVCHFGKGDAEYRPYRYTWALPQDRETEDMNTPIDASVYEPVTV